LKLGFIPPKFQNLEEDQLSHVPTTNGCLSLSIHFLDCIECCCYSKENATTKINLREIEAKWNLVKHEKRISLMWCVFPLLVLSLPPALPKAYAAYTKKMYGREMMAKAEGKYTGIEARRHLLSHKEQYLYDGKVIVLKRCTLEHLSIHAYSALYINEVYGEKN